MQAIDELFTSNQVNMQLLSILPVVLLAGATRTAFVSVGSLIKALSRGGSSRLVETRRKIEAELREDVRRIERVLLLSTANGKHVFPPAQTEVERQAQAQAHGQGFRDHKQSQTAHPSSAMLPGLGGPGDWDRRDEFASEQPAPPLSARHLASDYLQEQQQQQQEQGRLQSLAQARGRARRDQLTGREQGELMSILLRVHRQLVVKCGHLHPDILRRLQHDLRDLMIPSVTVSQQLMLMQRILATYPCLSEPR
jgi:hypothetical protein